MGKNEIIEVRISPVEVKGLWLV